MTIKAFYNLWLENKYAPLSIDRPPHIPHARWCAMCRSFTDWINTGYPWIDAC